MGKKKEDLSEETRILFERLKEISDKMGYKNLDISHGVRSVEEQANLKETVEGKVADPHTSLHPYGKAMDLFFNDKSLPHEKQFDKGALRKIREEYNKQYNDNIISGPLIEGDEGHFQTLQSEPGLPSYEKARQELEFKNIKKEENMKKKKPFVEKVSPMARVRDLTLPKLNMDPRFLIASTDEEQALKSAEAQRAVASRAEEAGQQEEALIDAADESATQVEALQAAQEEQQTTIATMRANTPQNMEPTKDSGSMNPDLKEALLFLAPRALGMALGGALEGTQGALAGAEQAGKLQDQYNQLSLQKEELELKKQKAHSDISVGRQNYQLLQDFTDERGGPISFDKTTRKFFSGNKEVDSSKLVNLKNERSNRFATLQEQNLGIKSQQVGQLSDKQVETFAGMKATAGYLTEMERLAPKADIGIMATPINRLQENIGKASPEFTQLLFLTRASRAEYIKLLSGTAFSNQERESYMEMLPNEGEPLNTYLNKLKAFQRLMEIKERATGTTITKAQPLKAGAVQRVLETSQSTGKAPILTPSQKARLEQLKQKYNR
jgi:hypothetical protein